MSQVYWFEKDKARRGCPCLFLDRDGVIVEEVDYLCRREDVRILNGAAELIDSARLRGWAIGLISNQAGIARGYYDWAAFGIVQEEVVERLGMGPSPFDFVVACASHPDAVDLFHRIENHSCRKPNAGMLRMAAAAMDLDLKSSVFVGDQLSDIRAAGSAQVERVFHVRTGHGHEQRADVEAFVRAQAMPVILVEDLVEVRSHLGWSSSAPLTVR
ncbi:MAG: HAD-IIIA family hydrolase [Methylovirgula sp.]